MHATLDSLEQRLLFATNLLLNGDFETPAIGVGASGQSFTTVPAGSSLISHWKVAAGSVDIVSNAGVGFSTKPASGKQCIDMDGLAPGTLTQSAPTLAGHRYLLRFAWTATPFVGGGSPTTRKLDVQFGGRTIASLSKSVAGETPTNPGWKFSEYLVAATGSSSAVTFIAKSAGTLGMAIDAVSLVAAPFGRRRSPGRSSRTGTAMESRARMRSGSAPGRSTSTPTATASSTPTSCRRRPITSASTA
jgi:hypothetical protein